MARPNLTKVYVSSTYGDLVLLRQKVLNAVRGSPSHVPVSMEHYPAASGSSLDYCLRDVRQCDVYVGLLGSRYGSVPKGHTKSFTELEYDEAIRCNKPRLWFLLKQEPVAATDEDYERASGFRGRVMDAEMCKLVDEATIGETVTQSLWHLAGEQKSSGEREQGASLELLPYTCDRTPQTEELALFLRGSKKPPGIPICIVHGSEEQSPAKFVDWLKDELMADRILRVDATELRLNYPQGSSDTFTELLTFALEGAAQLSGIESKPHLAAELSRRDDYYFVADLPSAKFTLAERDRLKLLHDYFATWPPGTRPPRAFIVWVSYPEQKTGIFGKLFGSSERSGTKARDLLEALSNKADFPNLKVVTELGNVKRDDVTRWLEEPDVKRVSSPAFEENVTDLCKSQEEWKMKPLARELSRLLVGKEKGTS